MGRNCEKGSRKHEQKSQSWDDVDAVKQEADSRETQGEAYREEQSVIHKDKNVGGPVRVTRDAA